MGAAALLDMKLVSSAIRLIRVAITTAGEAPHRACCSSAAAPPVTFIALPSARLAARSNTTSGEQHRQRSGKGGHRNKQELS